MDDYDPNPQTKIMSPNELNANMKNSIEQKLLLNQNKIYRNEYKNNCLVIKNMKINAESLYDAIKKKTVQHLKVLKPFRNSKLSNIWYLLLNLK